MKPSSATGAQVGLNSSRYLLCELPSAAAEKKTPGGLELEGLYDELRKAGPKKYAAIKAALQHIARQLDVDISAAEAKAKTAKAQLARARSKAEKEAPQRLLDEATAEATAQLLAMGADAEDLKERVFGRVMEWKANGIQARRNGKTTLVKLLLGELEPTEGEIYRNGGARLALVNQHHADQIDLTLTPLQASDEKRLAP